MTIPDFMGLGRVELPTSRLSGAPIKNPKSAAGPVFIGQEPLSPATSQRERAAAERLGRFRGDMGDEDFAKLVADVVRVHLKEEGRQPLYPWDMPTVSAQATA